MTVFILETDMVNSSSGLPAELERAVAQVRVFQLQQRAGMEQRSRLRRWEYSHCCVLPGISAQPQNHGGDGTVGKGDGGTVSLLLGNDQAIQQIVKIQSDLVVLLKDTGQIDAGIAGEQICQRRNGGVGGGDEIRIAGAAGGIAACVLVDQRKLASRLLCGMHRRHRG